MMEAAPKRGDEVVVTRTGLRPAPPGRRVQVMARGGQPEANEQRQSLDADTDIPFKAGQTSILLSRRLAIAASRRSSASGDKKDAIAASAINDSGCSRRAA